MSSSSIRIDRYVTMAAFGSGALGLAVSPLHGDVQYDSNVVTLDVSGGGAWSGTGHNSSTGSSFHIFAGGDVQWSLGGLGFRSAWNYTYSSGNSLSGYFQRSSGFFTEVTWTVGQFLFARVNQDQAVGPELSFRAGDLLFMASSSDYELWSSWTTSGASVSRESESEFQIWGPLSLGKRGFIGLELENDSGDIMYAWADMEVSSDGLSLTVHGWAYEDSGAAILAGQTGESSTPVPGLGGLAALACGAAGLRRKRNRVA